MAAFAADSPLHSGDGARPAAPWREALATVGTLAPAVLLVSSVVIALGGPGVEHGTATTVTWIHAVVATTAAALVVRATTRLKGRQRVAWTAIAVAAVLDAGIDLMWAARYAVGRPDGTTPTWIAASTVANVVLVLGVIALPPTTRRVTRSVRLDVAIMMTAATCLLWVLPIDNLLRDATDGKQTLGFVALCAIKVLTVVVAMAALVRCRPDTHDEIRPIAFWCILLGLADLMSASARSRGYPMSDRFADSLYIAGSMCVALSGWRLSRPPRPPIEQVPGAESRRVHRLAPPETVTVVALVALALHGQFVGSSPAVTLALGALLVLLAIVRLGLLEHEQRELVESLRRYARTLHKHARVDALTGLGNRLALDERLQSLEWRSGGPSAGVAVFFIDVDHFKRFNDGLGHHVGDRLLVEIAGRLRDVLGPGVHRVGGDEFVAVCAHTDARAAELLAQDVVTIARAPVYVDGHELRSTVSVGLSHLDSRPGPADAATLADTLLRRADLALYSAKEQGRNRWEKYDPLLQHRSDERMRVQQGLHRAVELGEIEIHYRPVVELETRRTVGASASPRWCSPDHGVVLPATFMPAVLDGGLLPQIGSCLFEDIARRLRGSDELGGSLQWISTPLDREEIVHPGLVERVVEAFDLFRADLRRLRVEVTEATVLDNAAIAVLEELGELGVQLTVHRFGTGPSSLLNLGSYPASTISVDASFVEGLGRRNDDTVIVRVVAGLTVDLGLELAAEEVREEFQAQMLAGVGCALGHGPLFGDHAPFGEHLLTTSAVETGVAR